MFGRDRELRVEISIAAAVIAIVICGLLWVGLRASGA